MERDTVDEVVMLMVASAMAMPVLMHLIAWRLKSSRVNGPTGAYRNFIQGSEVVQQL